MKAVIQRVSEASVTVEGKLKGYIDQGLLVYLGVAHDDNCKDADWLCDKIINLRILDDSDGVMNLSISGIVNQQNNMINTAVNLSGNPVNDNLCKTGILVISQFTLLADARKGRRPSWNNAAPTEKARELYEYFIIRVNDKGILCEYGEFQARMKVKYSNEGPVTILLDSKDKPEKNTKVCRA